LLCGLPEVAAKWTYGLGDKACCTKLCGLIPLKDGEVGGPLCTAACLAAKPVENGAKACKPLCSKLFTPGSILYGICIKACKAGILLCGLPEVAAEIPSSGQARVHPIINLLSQQQMAAMDVLSPEL